MHGLTINTTLNYVLKCLEEPWNDPSVGELGMILGSPTNSSGVEGRGSSDSVVSGTSMAWLDKCRDPTNPAGVHTSPSSSTKSQQVRALQIFVQ